MTLPDEETFEVWRTDYVTKLVFKALDLMIEDAKNQWIEESWGGGAANEARLIHLKAEANALTEIRAIKHEDLEDILSNEELQRDNPD